jgi:hypothetical protein
VGLRATAAFGQERSLAEVWQNDRLRIRKRPFRRIAAAQNHLIAGNVGFRISKRKKLPLSDFVAY